MKGKTSDMTIAEYFGKLFAQNEGRSKPWTDKEITALMGKEFPPAKGKTTITRVRMFRSGYNACTYSYEDDKPRSKKAGAKNPWSYEYDAKGNVIEPRAKFEDRPKAKPAASKKKTKKKGKVVTKGPSTKVEVMTKPQAAAFAKEQKRKLVLDAAVFKTKDKALAAAKEQEGQVIIVKSGANAFNIGELVSKAATSKKVATKRGVTRKVSKASGKKVRVKRKSAERA